ncbi:aspartic peptidase domain-containing protein [Hygrophoropsis aurantiaca]|uniref:Aspartic peptidase domain-containing protein n=1 Tax=Hygrophoropsis aurantiaca TaxID=72124 RepID=A0ACB8A8I3_9AGAM|nr:aspartic peptidase domain-containing protein [Hygrophoropsis aurantiaca]
MLSSNLLVLALVFADALLESAALVARHQHANRDSAPYTPLTFVAVKRAQNSTNPALLNVTSEGDMQYLGKVNVGGHDFTLVLDTGSSDLWVSGNQKLKITNQTNTNINLTYGIGSAAGNIAYAAVNFGGYHIDNQAFLNAETTYEQNGQGILGLGFTSLSAIQKRINSKIAQPLMANIFAQQPNAAAPAFVALALERTPDKENTAGGVLSIGQYDPRFAHVSATPRYALAPADSARWTIALGGVHVNGRSATDGLKSGVPKADVAIALIDSGTSLAYVPRAVVDAIYGSIGGAVHITQQGEESWFVPCLGQANVSFTFGNETFSLNPLELSSPVTVSSKGKQYTVCLNTFRPPLATTGNEFDFLLGDIFMRNVYSVFNFGQAAADGQNNKGASIQFLPRTNKDQVYRDFEGQRKMNLQAHPPLFDLSKVRPDGTSDDGEKLSPMR